MGQTKARGERHETDDRTQFVLGWSNEDKIRVLKEAAHRLERQRGEGISAIIACASENCDAFSYDRDQYSSMARRKRYCYLFQKPFVTSNHPGYAFGDREVAGCHNCGAAKST